MRTALPGSSESQGQDRLGTYRTSVRVSVAAVLDFTGQNNYCNAAAGLPKSELNRWTATAGAQNQELALSNFSLSNGPYIHSHNQ